MPCFTACLPACKKLDSFSVFPLLKRETSRLLASKLDIMMLAALFGYGLEDEKEATAARDISFPEKSYDSFIDFLQVFENYNSVETFSPREEKFLVPVC